MDKSHKKGNIKRMSATVEGRLRFMVFFAVIALLVIPSTSQALILFQDDDFDTTIQSASLILGSNDAGATDTSIQFGADPISSENGLFAWNTTSNLFTFDHNVTILGGGLTTTGSAGVTTTSGGTITSNGLLTASNGLTMTTGALNATATSGALSLSGLSTSSISTGANPLNFTSSNFNTTSTGINSTAIGTTTPSTGSFTTLQASSTITGNGNLIVHGNTTLGDAATDSITFTGEILGASPLAFEGATNNDIRTTFNITDPTSNRTITFPDASGTITFSTFYQNQNIISNPRVWSGSATTTGGVATFFPTTTNTVGGTALFTNIYSINATAVVNTSSANSVPSSAVKLVSADKKTITVNAVNGQGVLLGGNTATFSPNGTTINLTIIGD